MTLIRSPAREIEAVKAYYSRNGGRSRKLVSENYFRALPIHLSFYYNINLQMLFDFISLYV